MDSPENIAPAPPRYRAPWWLAGAHVQTVYPALFGRPPEVTYVRERWETTPHGKPDGDFIDVDRITGDDSKPLLVVFHGLEGSSESPYARYLMAEAKRRGWRGLVAHFRGCGGEMNRLPRAYHSGDSAEIDWVLRRARAESPSRPLYVASVSLGGNATLKWLGEQGDAAVGIADAAIAISAPVDLTAAGEALEHGFCKVYTYNFLATMKKNALAKLARFPGLFNAEKVRRAKTLREFDNEVTAPLHGFRDTDDYWTRASAKPGLPHVRIPTLMLNALNDPFLPAWALPSPGDVSSCIKLDFPADGGHVGFLRGPFPGNGAWLPERAFHFFDHGN
jgi:predicted alpha/beta-fold hydrolase